jgi:hypothetical protein
VSYIARIMGLYPGSPDKLDTEVLGYFEPHATTSPNYGVGAGSFICEWDEAKTSPGQAGLTHDPDSGTVSSVAVLLDGTEGGVIKNLPWGQLFAFTFSIWFVVEDADPPETRVPRMVMQQWGDNKGFYLYIDAAGQVTFAAGSPMFGTVEMVGSTPIPGEKKQVTIRATANRGGCFFEMFEEGVLTAVTGQVTTSSGLEGSILFGDDDLHVGEPGLQVPTKGTPAVPVAPFVGRIGPLLAWPYAAITDTDVARVWHYGQGTPLPVFDPEDPSTSGTPIIVLTGIYPGTRVRVLRVEGAVDAGVLFSGIVTEDELELEPGIEAPFDIRVIARKASSAPFCKPIEVGSRLAPVRVGESGVVIPITQTLDQ